MTTEPSKLDKLDKLDRAFKAISLARKHSRLKKLRLGTIPCPICLTGQITYYKSPPYNRFAGTCSTSNCVAWTNQ